MAEKRQPVVHGGFWSTPSVTYSKETQNLIKTMMQESKLTNFQQRQLDKAMKSGETLPTTCHPTSSAKPRKPAPKKPQSKVLNPKNYTSHARTKEQIEATGAYEREKFQPVPQTKFGGFYERDKQRFANMMAYGEDIPEPTMRKIIQKAAPHDQEEVDRFDELQQEIDSRRDFLQEMEGLGRGAQYRTVIETEISKLIREMEVIDKKRTAELERLIAEEQKKQT